MDADYPAAHSMNTSWFAVDKDGHVACFDSGEAGAIPVESQRGLSVYAILNLLVGGLPRQEAFHDLQGRSPPAAPAEMLENGVWMMEHDGHGVSPYPLLMLLSSLALTADAI